MGKMKELSIQPGLARKMGYGKRGGLSREQSQNRRMSNRQIRVDIAEIVKKLDKYVIELKADRKEMLMLAAEPVKELMRSKAPVFKGGFMHDRYEYKGKGKTRNQKGKGNVVASYLAGNLKGSIDIIPLPKSIDIYVGPVFNKTGMTSGTFGETRYDPYYAWWVEFGTQVSNYPRQPFVRPAQAAFPQSLQILARELDRLTAKFNRENRITIPNQ